MDTRIENDALLLTTTLAANQILRQMIAETCGSFYSEARLRPAQVEAVMLALVESGDLKTELWTRKVKK